MKVTVSRTPIEGVLIITPDVFRDDRGFFMESYHRAILKEQGVDLNFVQDNHSRSRRGVLRGLHYQNASAPQYRLVRCTVGEIFDVIVDLRVGSPTFGQHLGLRLSSDNQWQVLIPPGFAHGFQVLSETAEVQYKVSGHHQPEAERSLFWNDPDLKLPWPIDPPFVSARDKQAPSFKSYAAAPDFFYGRDIYGLTA